MLEAEGVTVIEGRARLVTHDTVAVGEQAHHRSPHRAGHRFEAERCPTTYRA